MARWLCAIGLYAAEPNRIMLLDGESGGPYHKWQLTTPVLKKATGRDRAVPGGRGDRAARGRRLQQLQAGVQEVRGYSLQLRRAGRRWSQELKNSFEQYVKEGGGVVIVHAADNAFPGWEAFNDMIGVGGWRGRTEKAGPFWYYKDGKVDLRPFAGKRRRVTATGFPFR